jgi:hypothetical protein
MPGAMRLGILSTATKHGLCIVRGPGSVTAFRASYEHCICLTWLRCSSCCGVAWHLLSWTVMAHLALLKHIVGQAQLPYGGAESV